MIEEKKKGWLERLWDWVCCVCKNIWRIVSCGFRKVFLGPAGLNKIWWIILSSTTYILAFYSGDPASLSAQIIAKFNIAFLFDPAIVELVKTAAITVFTAALVSYFLSTTEHKEIISNYVKDIIHNPKHYSTEDTLYKYLKNITERLLEARLPFSHKEAAKLIKEHYFTSDKRYHYEDMDVRYKVIETDDGYLLSSSSSARMVVFNPEKNYRNVVLPYHYSIPIGESEQGGRDSENVSFHINNRGLDHYPKLASKPVVTIDEEKSLKLIKLEIPITKDLLIKDEGEGNRSCYVRKEAVVPRDFIFDPAISFRALSYIKGIKVTVKAPKHFVLNFDRQGFRWDKKCCHEGSEDIGNNMVKHTWLVEDANDLLLPGEAFTIIVGNGK